MNSEWFEKVIKGQIKTCEDVLIGKAKEYATDDDRLHNFKNAAGMMSCDPKEALAGMMAKHTISVYDMCRSGKDYPIELWNEKITDHINYLLLLKAIIEEEKSPAGKNREYSFTDFVKDIWPNYRSQLNNIKDAICNYEEEPYFTAAYGEVPTFNGKPVEIKKQDAPIDKVIKGLTICVDGECNDCPYNDGYCGDCSDNLKKDAAKLLKTYKKESNNTSKIKEPDEKHIQDVIDGLRYCNADTCGPCYKNEEDDAGCIGRLREDAAELLEKYKQIIGDSASKSKDDAPKIKEDPKALDEAIKSFRRTLVCCGDAKCEACHHYNLLQIGEKCSTGLLDEFDNIVIRLKEAPNDNT